MPDHHSPLCRPRTPREISQLPPCPEVVSAASTRGVTQIVHFTTTKGAIGILAANAVKSRARLPEDSYLEYIYEPNTAFRKDTAWLDYVNLSIERINDWMFEASSRWHPSPGNPWVVLSFVPSILAHSGVVFATTNNIYQSCRRNEGILGFDALFSSLVPGRYGYVHTRADKSTAWPTDRQAEVLYPGELSCKCLQRIYVQHPESAETIEGTKAVLDLTKDIPVQHAPEVFE